MDRTVLENLGPANGAETRARNLEIEKEKKMRNSEDTCASFARKGRKVKKAAQLAAQ